MKGVTHHQTLVRDEHNETRLKDGGTGLTIVASVASKNSVICGKFEIRSRSPGIIAVRNEFWIVKLEVG